MINQFMTQPLPAIPDDIAEAIYTKQATYIGLKEKNDVLTRKELILETGYAKGPDGNYMVAMYCEMPGITKEMIDWWFWWHPQADERYQVWFPGAHKKTGYSSSDRDYFSAGQLPPFRPNSQYPKETIGGMTTTLQIDFVTPQAFGFSQTVMDENDVAAIVCGHVGLKNLFQHTEMAHIFKKAEDGLFMYSRFWMGDTCRFAPARNLVTSEKMVRGMTEHCCVEYRNLARILPALYEAYA